MWKIQNKINHKFYAMKEISKVKIYKRKAINLIKNEMIILSNLHHPFIINLYYAFQDTENLYLIMDFLTGGDLRYFLRRHYKLNEESIIFIISNIILILEYLNENNIIHRDLKPDNLLFDKDGYLNLIDFGISNKSKSHQKYKKLIGSLMYIAPEILINKTNDFSSDYFSLGIIFYELVFGKRPYIGKNKNEILEQILFEEIHIDINDIPNKFNNKILIWDFISKLLKKEPKERLGGINGIKEIKNHPLFNQVQWDKILNKQINSPFLQYVKSKENFDSNLVNQPDKFNCENYYEILEEINNKDYFKEFYYNSYDNYQNYNKDFLDFRN